MSTFMGKQGSNEERNGGRENNVKHFVLFSLLNQGLKLNCIYRLRLRINSPAAAAPAY